MKNKTYDKISPQIVEKLGCSAALVGGYLAGNKVNYRPNIKAIATRLSLGRSLVTRALDKLHAEKLVERDSNGKWIATQLLLDEIKADSFIIWTNILTDRTLNPCERLLLGYLDAYIDHSVDETVSYTGMKKNTIQKYIAILSNKGLITKDDTGTGRGNKRHFHCVDAVATEPEAAEFPLPAHTPEFEAMLEQYKQETAEQLEGYDPSLNPELVALAVQILAEIYADHLSSEIDVDGTQMKIGEVWELVVLLDGSALDMVANRISDNWSNIGNKKAYLQKSLLREAKRLYDFA